VSRKNKEDEGLTNHVTSLESVKRLRYMVSTSSSVKTVLGYFGFNRTVYGNKKNYTFKKMVVARRIKTGKRRRYRGRNKLVAQQLTLRNL
jgi:hypothetical protein